MMPSCPKGTHLAIHVEGVELRLRNGGARLALWVGHPCRDAHEGHHHKAGEHLGRHAAAVDDGGDGSTTHALVIHSC